jgi:hypothetical protein
MKSNRAAIIVTVLIVSLYAAPHMAVWRAMHYSPVPPALAPDLYLYLGLSKLPIVDGHIKNPWYGMEVDAKEVPYFAFGRAISLFGQWDSVVGSTPWALLLWNTAFTALICVCAWWFFRTAGIVDPLSLALATGTVTLVNFETVRQIGVFALRDYWTHPVAWVPINWLPYVRSFFPQFIVPLLFCYFIFLLQALRGGGRWLWAGMAAIQLGMLVTYPYALFVVVMSSGVALLATFRHRRWRLSDAAVFAAICALSDGLYLATHSGSQGGKFFDIDAQKFLSIARVTPLILAALSIATLRLVRDRALAAMIGGAGLAIAAAYALDAVLSAENLMTVHVLYLFHTVVALMVILLLRDLVRSLQSARMAALLAVFASGILGAVMTCVVWQEQNVARAELASIIGQAQAGDLIIAATNHPVAEPAWLPLLSRAQVLYCRDVDPSAGRGDLSARFALQLHLQGRSAADVRADLLTYPERRPNAYSSLLPFRVMGLAGGRRSEEARAQVAQQLGPYLTSFESSPQAARSILGRYKRLWVVTPVTRPLPPARHVQIWPAVAVQPSVRSDLLERYAHVEREVRSPDWVVTIARSSPGQ